MRRCVTTLAILLSLLAGAGISFGKTTENKETPEMVKTGLETLPAEDAKTRYTTLTEADFRKVASRLGVEVAAIKAVVVIEAGPKMEGFWAPGVPVMNFDQSMYNKYKSKATSKGNPSEKVPTGLSGYALKEWTQLVAARKVTVDGANMGAFWGMFQIGGFNYKLCGCQSVAEFVKLMSYSELEQLELFATFIINSGMVNDLKNKNWSNFARRYNGASYAKRGYHTKMADAYKKFKGK
ncbi:MAG: N-acetylmuramidase family protein [Muribaculaceae bacterium]|nr:N-acetylmuramidase family protein [Muribaculaceae bacterium]